MWLRSLTGRSSQLSGMVPSALSSTSCLGGGRLCIDCDHARGGTMRRNKRFREEIFGCLGIPGGTEPKFQGVSLRIFGAREGHPDLFHFHVRLIDAPGVSGSLTTFPNYVITSNIVKYCYSR